MRSMALFCMLLLIGCASKRTEIFNGYVEGEFRLLSSLESGLLSEIKVSKGDFVKKGTVLANIEGTGAKLSIDEIKASYSLAKAEFERSKVLVKDGIISKAAAQKIAADLEKAQAEYNKALWLLNEHAIKAPEDGYIQAVLQYTGELATPQNPVIYFLPKDGVKVRFFVPENRLIDVKLGRKVNIFVDGASSAIGGIICFISNRSEFTPPIIYSNASREKLVFLVEATINNLSDDLVLKPGQPVDIQLEAYNE